MPDLGSLTDEQRAALNDLGYLLDEYRQAVERLAEADRTLRLVRSKLSDAGYRIAGIA